MHKILTHELSSDRPRPGEPRARAYGFFVGIEPPININQDIVDKVVLKNSLQERYEMTISPFSMVTLIGSTHERTTLYARLSQESNSDADINNAHEELRVGVSQLLGVLGVQDVVMEEMSPPFKGSLVV